MKLGLEGLEAFAAWEIRGDVAKMRPRRLRRRNEGGGSSGQCSGE